MICIRPIPTSGNGWHPLWSREGRDAQRKKDNLRCRCGEEGCRDKEVKTT